MKEHLRQVFDEKGRHYLINTETGAKTRFASYINWTYLDGFVGVTDFFTGEGEKILTPHEFCHMAGVK